TNDIHAPRQIRMPTHHLAFRVGQDAATALQHGSDQQHVGRVLTWAHVEPLVDVLAQDTGSERSEAFSELDLEVQCALGVLVARISDDAPGTQRPGAELRAAVEPPDCAAFGNGRGHVFEEQHLIPEPIVLRTYPVQKTLDRRMRVGWAKEGCLLDISPGSI